MIGKLRSMAIFATVVDQGSFRAAGLHLNLAPSRISQAVSDLETQLGVTLLYRSTRRLSLTSEGQVLYEKSKDMLQAAENGLDAISQLSSEPAGELRVTAPDFMTQTPLMEAFAEFAKSYPNVHLKLNFSDRPRDLIKEGFDVGIRAGIVEKDDLSSCDLNRVERLLVASPDYVSSKAPLGHPRELEEWDWIGFEQRSDQIVLTLATGQTASVVGKAKITVDSADALFEFAVRGLGVSVIPEHLARRGFERGELVHVLPQWSLQPLAYYPVWPDRSHRTELTLMFERFLLGPK